VSKREQSTLPPLGKRVRQLREKNAWTQEQLAQVSDVSLRTIQKLETTGQAGLETCTYLANALDIEVAELTALRDLKSDSAPPVPINEGVSEYLGRFQKTIEAQLVPWVELRAIGGEPNLTQNIEEVLLAGRNAAVLGPAGAGKSHAVLRVAARLCSRRAVPILTRAGLFRGVIDEFLEKAVSPFTLLPFEDLVAAAAGATIPVVLVVDGFNEPPPSLQEALANGIQALLLRFPSIRLVITSQNPPPMVTSERAETIEVATCNTAERVAILQAHGLAVSSLTDISKLVEAIPSPFDLSLAAKCWSDLPPTPTRYQLVHSFVRTVLEQQDAGPATIDFLCDLAARMVSTLSTSLELPDAYRMWPETSGGSTGDLHRLLRGPLLRAERGRCFFAHELLMSFFAAEHLLRSTTDLRALADQLETPRARPLTGLVVEAQTTEHSMRELLASTSGAKALYGAIDSGEHGPLAREVLRQDLAGVLRACAEALLESRVKVVRQERPDGRKMLEVTIDYPWLPSDQQRSLLFFLGAEASPDEWIKPILSLFVRFDSFLKAAAERISSAQGIRVEAVAQTLYNSALSISGSQNLLVRDLIHGVANRNGLQGPAVRCLTEWFMQTDSLSPGMLQVLCDFGHRCTLEESSQRAIAGLLSKIVHIAWKGPWDLTKLDALALVEKLASHADDTQRGYLLGTLQSLETKNPMLNSCIFEAIEACGGEVQYGRSADDVLKEIRTILGSPDTESSQQRANGIHGAQFELLSALSVPHLEAVEALGEPDRLRFLAMAALGCPEGLSSSMDCCLRSMLVLPGAADDRYVQQALERWAAPPFEQSVMPQEAAGAFAQAHVGLASLGLPDSQPTGPTTLGQTAWMRFGQLLYLAARKDQIDVVEPIQGHADRLWGELAGALLAESVEPFVRLLDLDHWWPRNRHLHVLTLVQAWPNHCGAHALEILERVNLESRRAAWDRAGTQLTQCAAAFGGASARARLARLVDHPSLGHEALAAIRVLDGRSQ
jgi:transcriptional regulator with XRE-family HTH domain